MMIFVLYAAAAIAILLCGGLYFRQYSLVFRPGPPLSRTPLDVRMAFEDVWLPIRRDIRVHGWWIPGPNGGKAAIFFHGNGRNLAHELPTLGYLHALGTNVLAIDYPGFGDSSGKARESNCYRTAEACWRYVGQRGFRPEDVIVFGQSLGTGIATHLAAAQPCGGLVFHSGFTSVPDLAASRWPYLPVRYFCHTRMRSADRIARCRCPLLVLHSESDEVVSFHHGLKVHERHPGPKRLVRLQGGHDSLLWLENPEVAEAWRELLSGRAKQWRQEQPCTDRPGRKSLPGGLAGRLGEVRGEGLGEG